jgi:PKD repeat protein
VTKLNASGSALVYSTYLGGTGSDGGRSIKVDSAGNAYITGRADYTNFVFTASALDTSHGGGFVAKFNPTGSNLLYSSYLWSGDGYGLAIDSLANVYVTGQKYFNYYFPITPGAYDTTGSSFVCKLSLAPGPGPHFYANQTTGFNPLPVNFYDTSYGNPTSWYWNFGDGSTSTEKNPMHTYLHRGVYNVSLTAGNSEGTNAITKNNYIMVQTTTKVDSPFWTLFE